MVISKGDHDTMQGQTNDKNKATKNKSSKGHSKRAITKQLQLEVWLVCGLVANIPDGIAREDSNRTEVFFE